VVGGLPVSEGSGSVSSGSSKTDLFVPPQPLPGESQSTKQPELLFRALLTDGAQRCASTCWSKNLQPPGVRFRALLTGGDARIFFHREGLDRSGQTLP
jgi:hypothetical protein